MAALLTTALLMATLLMPTSTSAFMPFGGGASTHVTITKTALLQKVRETCEAVAKAAGYEFTPTGSSPEELVQACLGPTASGDISGAKFLAALQQIYMQNGLVDRDFINSAPHHFHSEAFLEGRSLIMEGLGAIKANIKVENFQAARETLGRVLHTLQDFYSNSNWVELGFSEPYVNLITPGTTLDNIADVDTPTCRDCSSGRCLNPLLTDVLLQQKLTSGYMGVFTSSKPTGKCSHGGSGDLTSSTVPRGGISKDERRSDDDVLHKTAVNLATRASTQLMENIRLAAGDNHFLRMMGIARSSVVSFVIDTTGSMADDIEEVILVVYKIIDSKKGTQDEPSEYILVPFNDPKFGPMVRTVDPEEMKREISKLKANGGGDAPEMCLSGLQLALTGAPSSSHIYVFTDATAKDIALKDSIVALIRSTKSTVSFFMTGGDKALASGGQDIQVSIAHSSVVSFVIDTRASADDIEELRSIVYEMIDSNKGTQDEPSEYILVPFNNREFGPLIKTQDPEEMKREISKLKANGGGDTPGMCLSGLQLALIGASSSSQIYVFTNALAKDIDLKDSVIALIRSTKSTVSFFMTGGAKRWRRSAGRAASFNDYKDLALASGGQAIQVSKSQLPQATDIILDSSTSALVTVLQQTRNPGTPETFPFMLDGSLKNITIYITGTSITFTLTNPAGVTQSSSESSGKLGTVQSVGNLRRIRIHSEKQAGKWKVDINSGQPYTLKVTGQSTISFIYNIVESFGGAHPGYAVQSGRPQAGEPALLLLTVMGGRGPSLLEVGGASLALLSGPEGSPDSSLTPFGNGDFLLTVDSVPEGEFVVFLTGTDKESNSSFQRQSTTQISASKVNIKAAVVSSAEPGKPLLLPFSLMTQGAGGSYSINIRNDRGFPVAHPTTLTLTAGVYANATLTITPPASAPTGSDVTVTIEASKGVDSNYAILRLFVVTKITDFDPPLCKAVTVAAQDCPADVSRCGPFHWELWANITDGNGTVESVALRRGDGSLSLSALSAPAVHAAYNASCCSQVVELVAVDKVGNVGKCFHSIQRSGGAALTPSAALWAGLLLSALVGRRV